MQVVYWIIVLMAIAIDIILSVFGQSAAGLSMILFAVLFAAVPQMFRPQVLKSLGNLLKH